NDLYAVTHKHSPRYEVVRVNLKSPHLEHAEGVVPASSVVIQEADVAADAVYIRDLDGGIGRMRRLGFDGTIESIAFGDGQSVAEIKVSPVTAGARAHITSWTTAPRWFAYDGERKVASDTGIQPPLPI